MLRAQKHTTYFGLRPKEIIWIVLFYVFFSYLYNVVLWYQWDTELDPNGWLSLRGYWGRSGWAYIFYFFASILIWFLGVYALRKQSKITQVITVAILCPIVIYLVRELRYEIIDYLDLGRLSGRGEVWDWYIPLLFFYIQFGCFFGYRYFIENQRKLRVEGELRQAALKSELAAIKAQLNPHFLYNVFNTINASVPAENEKTRQMIAKLSDLFRYQLNASQQELVPLKEELDFVKNYLELEKERFGDRLEVTIDVDPVLYSEKIPPMLLQPIVENSIKHGLASLIDGGSIEIRILKKNEKLVFVIADTGVGVQDPSALMNLGVGLTNTQLRLQKMYQSQLEILDNHPKGLKVSFSI